MHHKYSLTILIFLSCLLFSCSDTKNGNAESTQNQVIKIKGSDTEFAMVKDLASAFMIEHPDITIVVEGGGSNAGMMAMAAGAIDVLNSSRAMSPAEIQALKERNIEPLPIQFATDALAIITNYKIGVDSLSTAQVSALYGGQIKNWAQLGGQNLPVKLIGRDASSGTRDYFMKQFSEKKGQGTIRSCISNAELLKEVIATPGAIGYVGAGFLFDNTGKPNGQIWAMPLFIEAHKAISPYETSAVKHGDYVLTRPLYQYIKGNLSEAIERFILFELSKQGQDIVLKHGYFPIVDKQTQINRLKGLPSI